MLLLFVDGLGVGPADPTRNPWAALNSRIFTSFTDRPARPIAFDGLQAATDACLGLSGLPQSATGQTALLTGVNAAAYIGCHLSGHPNTALRELLARESVFVKLGARGLRCTFANCYQPKFFEGGTPRRVSVTTSACLSAGIPLRTLDDLSAGRAVYQDFTHAWLRERGVEIDLREPEEAGAILAAISREYDFTLYEYFLTDLAGHSQDFERGLEIGRLLERFLLGLLENLDLARRTVVLSSDHGNFEDFSTPFHTRNPVYTICWGVGREAIASKARSITDITPALCDICDHRDEVDC